MLKKNLGFWQGLALYLAAVLGTGILVIPSLAWKEAGPASLISWAILGFLGFALAWSFAAVGSAYPHAGGIQNMIGRVCGKTTGDLSSWIILFSIPVGAVAGAHIFSDHFVATLGLSPRWTPHIAWASLMAAGLINFYGLKISANAQLSLSGLLVSLLVVMVIFSLPLVRTANLHPFAPHGPLSIGRSAVLIFWSFFGWEAVAHLAEEFNDPKDMFKAAWVAAVLVGVLYFAVAFVLIGTQAIDGGQGDRVPMTTLASNLFGSKAGVFTGALASVICFGTINAYMAGISRLAFAMGRDGVLPRYLGVLDEKTGTPRRSILFLLFMYTISIVIQASFQIPMHYFFLISNVAFMTLYTLGCFSASRLLKENRLVSTISFLVAIFCCAMIPFAFEILWYPLLILLFAFIYFHFSKQP